MARRSLDQTLELMRTLDRAHGEADVCKAVLNTARRFGAEYVLAGTIPIPGAQPREQRSHVVLEHWPAGWSQRYFSRGYLFRDPAIRRIATDTRPFLWDELEPLCADNPNGQVIMDEAGEFGLKQGLTIPLLTLEGETAGFSLGGERLEVSPEERGMLTLLATYAMGRAIALRESGQSTVEVSLSKRESEALQWAAEGKSEWEIGLLMGISEHGVDKHMRATRRKLGTTNRTHAVAEAIRRGLIN
jgi:LuxR family quorum sensing-dependent transcriptional regulator